MYMPRNKMLEFEGTLDDGNGMHLRLFGEGFEIKVALPFRSTNEIFQDWFKALPKHKREEVLIKYLTKMVKGEEDGEEEDD
jgi:hypothetical protein